MAYSDRFYGERVRRFSNRIETVLFDAYRRTDAHRDTEEDAWEKLARQD